MPEDPEKGGGTGVDKSLVAEFIKMTPEERLAANDRAMRAIWELRDAWKRRKDGGR